MRALIKRMLSLVLICALLIPLIQMSSSAASVVGAGRCNETITWRFTSDGVLTIEGYGGIPNYSAGGAPWYKYRESITELVFDEGICNIGNYTFYNCSKLTGELLLPEAVYYIGEYAFYGTNYSGSFNMPYTIKSIGQYAFKTCKFEGILVFGTNVTAVGAHNFRGSSFKGVYFLGDAPDIAGYSLSAFSRSTPLYYLAESSGWSSGHCGYYNVSPFITIGSSTNGTSITVDEMYYDTDIDTKITPWATLQTTQDNAASLMKTVTCTSSNTSVVTVGKVKKDAVGKNTALIGPVLQPKAPGTAIITLKTTDGASCTCFVTVEGNGTSVRMTDTTPIVLVEGASSIPVFAEIKNPQAITYCEWESADSGVVGFVGQTGTVNGCTELLPADQQAKKSVYKGVELVPVSTGTTTITCRLSNGMEASQTVRVISKEAAKNETHTTGNVYGTPETQKAELEAAKSAMTTLQMNYESNFNAYKQAVYDLLAEEGKAEGADEPTLEEKASTLMSVDTQTNPRIVNFPSDFPADMKSAVYQAFVQILEENTGNAWDFANVDFSDHNSVVKMTNKINSAIRDMTDHERRISVNGGELYINWWGTSAGVGYFNFTPGKGYTTYWGNIRSDSDELAGLVVDYLKELRELQYNANVNIYNALMKDLAGCNIRSLANTSVQDQIKKQISNFEGALEELGVKELYDVLEYCAEFHSKASKIARNLQSVSSADITALASYRLDNLDIKGGYFAGSITKLLTNTLIPSQENYYNALVAYCEKGTVLENNVKNGKTKVSSHHCPVNVSVFDAEGTLLGYVGEDDLWYTEDLYIEEVGDLKYIYSDKDMPLTFEVVAYDDGIYNCSFEEYEDGRPTGRTLYYDLPLDVGTTYLIQTGPEGTTVTSADEETVIEQDEYLAVTDYARVDIAAISTNETMGTVTGGGAYTRGDGVILYAEAEEGYRFAAWYDSEGNICSIDPYYTFTARENAALTAHFALDQFHITVAGATTRLGNEIALNIVVKASDITETGLTAYVVHHAKDGDITYEYPQSVWKASGGYYRFAAPVKAMQMTDQISLEVRDGEGNVYNEPYSTSVRDYVGRILPGNGTSYSKILMVDMVNYGATAQEYFGYETDDLANANLTEEQKALATADVACGDDLIKGANYIGSTLNLKDRILMNVYFKNDGTSDVSDLYAMVSFTGYKGNVENHRVDVKSNKNGLYVEVNQTVLGDSFEPVTVTVYNADGTVYGQATDSVESYVARNSGSNALYMNIIKFAYSGREYMLNT